MNVNILRWYLVFCEGHGFTPTFQGLKNYAKYFKMEG